MWPFKKKLEERAVDPSWAALSGYNTATGALVNPRTAEQSAALLAAVNIISTMMASLDIWVYRLTETGRVLDENHPVQLMFRRGPNEWQTTPAFIEWFMGQVLLRGNSVAEIVIDGAGNVVELRPVPFEWCSLQLLSNRRLAYDISELTSVFGGTGKMRRLLQDEVIHFRDRTDDGLIGRSRLSRAAAAVSAGLNLQNFTDALFANGAFPSGAVSVAGKLGADARKDLQRGFQEGFGGVRNAARLMILDQGLTWQSISISPEDAELLQSRRFSVEEIARIYAVPPPLIGDLTHGTFTNSETLIRFFAQSTLASWCRKLEAEFTKSLFSEADKQTHQIEIDLSSLLRGDPESRWASHKIAVEADILTRNEVREIEGYGPMAEKPQPNPTA